MGDTVKTSHSALLKLSQAHMLLIFVVSLSDSLLRIEESGSQKKTVFNSNANGNGGGTQHYIPRIES